MYWTSLDRSHFFRSYEFNLLVLVEVREGVLVEVHEGVLVEVHEGVLVGMCTDLGSVPQICTTMLWFHN